MILSLLLAAAPSLSVCAGPQEPAQTENLLGAPITIDGEPLPEQEVKRFLCFGLGGKQADQAKFAVILGQELQRRQDAGEDVSKYVIAPEALEKRVEKERKDFLLKYPTLDFATEVGRAFLSVDLWKSQMEQTMLFDMLFFPDNPEEWPALTNESIISATDGTMFLDDAKESYFARLQYQQEQALEELPPEDPLLMDYFRQVVLEALNNFSEIVTAPGRLDPGVLMAVDGTPVMIDTVFATFRPHVTRYHVADARKFLVMMELMGKELRGRTLGKLQQELQALRLKVDTLEEGEAKTALAAEAADLEKKIARVEGEAEWMRQELAAAGTALEEAKAAELAARDELTNKEAELAALPAEAEGAESSDNRELAQVAVRQADGAARAAARATRAAEKRLEAAQERIAVTEENGPFYIPREWFEDNWDELTTMNLQGGRTYQEMLIIYEMMARSVLGFDSLEAFATWTRVYESYKRWIREELDDDDLMRAELARSNQIAGAARLNCEVILSSAFDWVTNDWRPNGWVEAKERAERLKKMLDEGADWGETIELYSEYWDPPLPEVGQKPQFGLRNKGRFAPSTRAQTLSNFDESEFTQMIDNYSVADIAFFDMKPGEVAGPFQGRRGYYIVKVQSKTPPQSMLNMANEKHREFLEDYYAKRTFIERCHELLATAIASKRVKGL
jgi:hypothetical protein